MRPVPKSPLVDSLRLTASGGPRPGDRTMQFLRLYDLTKELKGDPQRLLEQVQEIIDREPSADKVYAIAELSYLQAKRVEADNPHLALNLYGAAALQAYKYLFDDRFRDLRNPYDPQFRGACDLYNGSLEAALRLICKERGLSPGQTYTIHTPGGVWELTCELRGGPWQPGDFGRFEFVSDYEIRGLKNHYQTYGLGVPLIAVRRSYPDEPAAARYYPPGLSYPVTAFLRPVPENQPDGPMSGPRHQGVLELYDPLSTTDIPVAGVQVPLESDVTTPLAYFLSCIDLEKVATMGLLRPDLLLTGRPNASAPVAGLYMVQPYEPGKIPVLLVHGLWSSPMTWMQMFNDLRSCPEIRNRYQFWFYLYPTAQPFWISAAQLRHDLAEARQTLDPEHREPALDQMVLVGHSMGGLVSRLQTLQSGQDFWNLVSDKPFEQVRADPEIRSRLYQCFFFEPNPSVRRVITLGTPHRGSSFSNETTQWLAARLIRLPQMLLQSQQALFRENRDLFGPGSLLRIETSIDSLSPRAPIFSAMIAARRAPWVRYHNVIGVLPQQGFLSDWAPNGDGVVSYESARMDDVASELVVPADHTSVHSHPLAVLEVRRILLEHLAELERFPNVAAAAPALPAARVATGQVAVLR
ncbi:MAG: alpha/beta fold hydrolase [Thermoguttaceae bacterium]|nr:alpha/beta fold hydrolase [Thermoguttaceae bacterium]